MHVGAPGSHFKAVHYFGMDSPLLLAVFFKKEWKRANEEGEFTFPFDKSASNLMWQGHIFYFRCFSVVTLLFVLPFLLSGCLQAAKSLCIYSFFCIYLMVSHFLHFVFVIKIWPTLCPKRIQLYEMKPFSFRTVRMARTKLELYLCRHQISKYSEQM